MLRTSECPGLQLFLAWLFPALPALVLFTRGRSLVRSQPRPSLNQAIFPALGEARSVRMVSELVSTGLVKRPRTRRGPSAAVS